MVAVLAELLAFAVKLLMMVPELVPLVPDEIANQLPPDVTAAVHSMSPVPVVETLSVVVPASFETA